jgi:tetratricopeptide (TPR) repeat protein
MVAEGPASLRLRGRADITRLDPDNPSAFGALAAMASSQATCSPRGERVRAHPEVRRADASLRLAFKSRVPDFTVGLEVDDRAGAASWDPDAAYEYGALIARELRAQGYNMSLGGGVNLAREPRNPEALGAKGRLLVAQGHARDALQYLEGATATADPESFIELARGYLAAGDAAKARDAAAEALRLTPAIRGDGRPWPRAHPQRSRGAGVEHAAQRSAAVGPRRPAVGKLVAGFDAAGNAARRRLPASCRGSERDGNYHRNRGSLGNFCAPCGPLRPRPRHPAQ